MHAYKAVKLPIKLAKAFETQADYEADPFGMIRLPTIKSERLKKQLTYKLGLSQDDKPIMLSDKIKKAFNDEDLTIF